jgi:hypothetical protein
MHQTNENLNLYLDKKLEKIGSAGDLFGRFLGMFGRHASKVVIGAGVLVIFGTAVFLWSLLQGFRRKK